MIFKHNYAFAISLRSTSCHTAVVEGYGFNETGKPHNDMFSKYVMAGTTADLRTTVQYYNVAINNLRDTPARLTARGLTECMTFNYVISTTASTLPITVATYCAPAACPWR